MSVSTHVDLQTMIDSDLYGILHKLINRLYRAVNEQAIRNHPKEAYLLHLNGPTDEMLSEAENYFTLETRELKNMINSFIDHQADAYMRTFESQSKKNI